jgi:FMN phosphatase YigB (HAD superfamily)
LIKLLTVDVWDTLLRRDCHPECIKLATAQHLLLGWFYKIRPEFKDCRTLYLERIEVEKKLAERSLATGQDGEYEITNVITEWLNQVFYAKPEKLLISKLIDFEITTEIERTFVDPEIKGFLDRHKSEKRIFLSDFYMRSNFLSKILEEKGISNLFDGGVSSCDVGLNKRSGRLFEYIHGLHNINPKDHVHIGDNYWSDYKSPISLGINALHYEPKIQHEARKEREELFSQDKLFKHISGKYENTDNCFGFSLAIDCAPFIIGFLIWVAEQIIIKRIDRVYFINDEGKFLESVYNKLFSDRVFFGHELPPCSVLEHTEISSFDNEQENLIALVSFLFADPFEHSIRSSNILDSKFISLASLCEEKNKQTNIDSYYFLDSERSIISDDVLSFHHVLRMFFSYNITTKSNLNHPSQTYEKVLFNFHHAILQAICFWKPFVNQYVISGSSLNSQARGALSHASSKYKKELNLLLSGNFLASKYYFFRIFKVYQRIYQLKNVLYKIRKVFFFVK